MKYRKLNLQRSRRTRWKRKTQNGSCFCQQTRTSDCRGGWMGTIPGSSNRTSKATCDVAHQRSYRRQCKRDIPLFLGQQVVICKSMMCRAHVTSWLTMACTIWTSRRPVNMIPAKWKSSPEAQSAKRWHQPNSMSSLARMITVAYSRIHRDVSKHLIAKSL